MSEVSGNRPTPLDHQPKYSQPGNEEVGLARITYYGDTRVVCSCGWSAGHVRAKVLEDSIDRHLGKKHDGRGIRL